MHARRGALICFLVVGPSVAGLGLFGVGAGGAPLRTTQQGTSAQSSGTMSTRWIIKPDTTRSTHWVNVDPDQAFDPSQPIRVPADGLVTATLDVNVTGGLTDFRITDNSKVAQPSYATFRFSRGASAGSFTFSRDDNPTQCGRTIRLQWRSPSGRQVRLHNGVVLVDYQTSPGTQPACP